jgi:hypothetical protein
MKYESEMRKRHLEYRAAIVAWRPIIRHNVSIGFMGSQKKDWGQKLHLEK